MSESVTQTQEISYQQGLLMLGRGLGGVTAQKHSQNLPQYQNLRVLKPCGTWNFVCMLHILLCVHCESRLDFMECPLHRKRRAAGI